MIGADGGMERGVGPAILRIPDGEPERQQAEDGVEARDVTLGDRENGVRRPSKSGMC